MTTASARKTRFGFKAVIVHANGRTEVLARKFALSADGRSMEQVRAGKNFATREQALAFARQTIEAQAADLQRRLADPRNRALREQHGLPRELPGLRLPD